jgi:serine/threonine protein kinase
MNDNGRLSEDQARRYFTQLLTVLEYLHSEQKVAHRDLKCENVLLDRYNNIRLIDFGLSNQFTDLNPQLRTACGSPAYAAPEMIQGNTYTYTADIWSAGILLFALVAGYLPFDDDRASGVLQKVVHSEVGYPAFISPQLRDLLQKMICKDPEERITLDMIKAHPWFSQSQYHLLKDVIHPESQASGQQGRIQKGVIDEISRIR